MNHPTSGYECPICRGRRYRHLLGVRRHLHSRHASLSQREISLICDIARDGCEAVEAMD